MFLIGKREAVILFGATVFVVSGAACGDGEEGRGGGTGGSAGSGIGGEGGATGGQGGGSGSCSRLTFTEPTEPLSGSLLLGEEDDVLGEACGEEFAIGVVVATDAPDGAMAELFVNGTSRGTATVQNLTARFGEVILDNRGDVSNSMRVEIAGAGDDCAATFASEILVDCAGPSCSISQPQTTTSFLNAEADTSSDDGLQVDVEVTTSADVVGENVDLIVDGSDTVTETASASGDGGVAVFGAVSLDEGLRSLQAVCVDGVGNTSRSGVARWTVDTVPCVISISSVAGGADPITANDDTNETEDGVQVRVTGSLSGEACEQIRVGLCSGISGLDLQASSGETFDLEATLSSSSSQEICAEVVDEAGNVGEASMTVAVRVDGPQLEIVTPATDSGFNLLGTLGRLADLDAGTAECEAAFTVYCSDVGEDVEIVRESNGNVLATAQCVAADGLPGFDGQATFSGVPIPSVQTGAALSLYARQTASGLTGTSDPVSLYSDCVAPSLGVTVPQCGGVATPADDVDSDLSNGIQIAMTVANGNAPKPEVTVTVLLSGSEVSSQSSSSPTTGPTTEFTSVDLGPGGALELVACAVDNAGNEGCTDACGILAGDYPSLQVDTPVDEALLTSADDCSAADGLQVTVSATTDADASEWDAYLQVGAGPEISAAISSGTITACIGAEDGRAVPVRAILRATGAADLVVANHVDIDTKTPTSVIDDLSVAPVSGAPRGTMRFTWTAVDDEDGYVLDSYELRCAEGAFADWDSADEVPGFSADPVAGGNTQTADVANYFKPGVPTYCEIRGIDLAQNPTPLPGTPGVEVNVAFTDVVVSRSGSLKLGSDLSPAGNVNGDSFDDFLIGASGNTTDGGEAYLFLGSASPSSAPHVRFAEAGEQSFGRDVYGIGRFNNDDLDDIAISGQGVGGTGKVWILLGRASWEPEYDLSGANCGDADFCMEGVAANSFFGWSLAALDFDGDGYDDLAIGARGVGSNSVYIIRGGADLTPGSYTTAAPMTGWVIPAPTGQQSFGYSITTPGSVNGDSQDDLVIGANGLGPTSTYAGVYQVHGRAHSGSSGLDVVPSGDVLVIETRDSFSAIASFASTVRVVGDIDHTDERAQRDLAVWQSGGQGVVFLYRQNSGFAPPPSSLVDPEATDSFGETIGLGWHPRFGTLGDLNMDGLDCELLVGATSGGSAELFYGPLSVTSRAQSDVTFAGLTGQAVVQFVGDLNNDGAPDIALGDPAANAGEGRVVIKH